MVNTPVEKMYVTRTSEVSLCDPQNSSPVTIIYGYDDNGMLLTATAVYPDGSPYKGDISKLISCNISAIASLPKGQEVMAKSIPVTLASDQSPVPVSVSSLVAGKVDQGAAGTDAWLFTGTVAITNFPASQVVSVSNFPATQPVSGSVTVSNFPATQPISGTVAVSNFPATQAISAASLPLPSGAATETTLAALNAKVTACNTGAVTISAALPTGTNTVGNVGLNALAAIRNGQKNVTTPGTQVALATTTAIKSVTIKAKSTNTGFIYVGATGVNSGNGFILVKGESVSLDVADLATVFLDSSVGGEGVSYIGLV